MGASFGFSHEDENEKDPHENGDAGSGEGAGLPPSFGFGPGANFEALFQQFSNFGINPQTLFAAGSGTNPLIAIDTIREVARKFLATQSESPIGLSDVEKFKNIFAIADNWLDNVTLFPTTTQSVQPAWSRRDWLDSSLAGWQNLVEPLAEGMAAALSRVIAEAGPEFTTEIGSEFGLPDGASASPEMLKGLTTLLRSFMGSLIATQLGQSVGTLATTVTGSNDVAIPLFAKSDSHLIPQNVTAWGEGLELPETEIEIYLALREAAASRLFIHAPWLDEYIRTAFTAYGKGIRVDLLAIQEQAESAVNSGDLDINNPESLSSAINQGLFTPEQSPEQESALARLEMALALIEGWIDHVVNAAAHDRIPSLAALNESLRRRRASSSPTQQLFAQLLGLEVSPRKMRECSAFWAQVLELRGVEGRDARWEDPALLPTASDLADVEAFLASTTVPDDLSGLI